MWKDIFLTQDFIFITNLSTIQDLVNLVQKGQLQMMWYNIEEDYWLIYDDDPQIRKYIYRFFDMKSYRISYYVGSSYVIFKDIEKFCLRNLKLSDACLFLYSYLYNRKYGIFLNGVAYVKGKLTLGSSLHNLFLLYNFLLFCRDFGLEYDYYCSDYRKIAVVSDLQRMIDNYGNIDLETC